VQGLRLQRRQDSNLQPPVLETGVFGLARRFQVAAPQFAPQSHGMVAPLCLTSELGRLDWRSWMRTYGSLRWSNDLLSVHSDA
jgi:hypothetical protein